MLRTCPRRLRLDHALPEGGKGWRATEANVRTSSPSSRGAGSGQQDCGRHARSDRPLGPPNRMRCSMATAIPRCRSRRRFEVAVGQVVMRVRRSVLWTGPARSRRAARPARKAVGKTETR